MQGRQRHPAHRGCLLQQLLMLRHRRAVAAAEHHKSKEGHSGRIQADAASLCLPTLLTLLSLPLLRSQHCRNCSALAEAQQAIKGALLLQRLVQHALALSPPRRLLLPLRIVDPSGRGAASAAAAAWLLGVQRLLLQGGMLLWRQEPGAAGSCRRLLPLLLQRLAAIRLLLLLLLPSRVCLLGPGWQLVRRVDEGKLSQASKAAPQRVRPALRSRRQAGEGRFRLGFTGHRRRAGLSCSGSSLPGSCARSA